MSWIDHHPLIIGLALFGLAYLNSRVTFPSSTARITGPTHPKSPLHSKRDPL